MAKVIVHVDPFKGEYPLDVGEQPFTTVEWRWIKKVSGYLPLTIEEGWNGGDADLFNCIAVIAMYRGGRLAKAEVLKAAEILEDYAMGESVTFEEDEPEEGEDEDDPKASEPSGSPSGSGESSDEPTASIPESESPKDSGTPDSDTGSDSAPLTLAR